MGKSPMDPPADPAMDVNEDQEPRGGAGFIDIGHLLNFPHLFKQRIQSIFSSLPFTKDLERKTEECVQRALSLLDVPSREEILDLHTRLEDLIKRCDALLTAKNQETKSPRSTAGSAESGGDPEATSRKYNSRESYTEE